VNQLAPPNSHHLIAADGWLGLGNWQEARAELRKITPELQAHPDVMEVRWQVCAAGKDWDEAIEVTREMTRQSPDLPFGWIHLAYSLHELRRTKEAYGTLKPIFERFPDEWLMRYNMACQMGDLGEARRLLELASKRGDKNEIGRMVRIDPDLEPLWPEFGKAPS
jgi:predicted Zn-dependent protease